MKAKIIYIAVFSGLIAFNLLLITSSQLYTGVPEHSGFDSHQFQDNIVRGEKAAFFATVIPQFVFLFLLSENPSPPFRVWPLSFGTRAPPALYESLTKGH